MSDLVTAWEQWRPDGPPYILEADRAVLETKRSKGAIVTYRSWQEAYSQPDFGAPGDTRLHLGLLPQPYCGNIREAEVYILLLNPGYSPCDDYGEYEVPAHRQAAINNLHQHFSGDTLPFFLLDPQFAWHSGYTWWHGKLAGIIGVAAKERGIPFADARKEIASKIASLELFPYHSTSFRDADKWVRRLKSAELARRFVAEHVLPKVDNGDATVVVMRQVQAWDVPEHHNIVRYTKKEARGAHLSPDSRGGRAILSRLGLTAVM
jgi:hypothetical protein